MQLDFLHPNYISAGIKWDDYLFHVRTNYSSYFYSDVLRTELSPDYYTLIHEVPPPISGWYTYLTIDIAKKLATFLKVLLWFSIFSTVFLSGNLRAYFAFLRTFQMVMHLPMLQIILPTSVIYFYSLVVPIAKWDIFEGWNFGL